MNYCNCESCKANPYPYKVDAKKLKIKGKRLYALLYLPTGEFIRWSDDHDNILIPRNYTVEAMVERVNALYLKHIRWGSGWGVDYTLIKRNEIIVPTIPQHYEKVELVY